MTIAAPQMKPWIEAMHAYVPGKSSAGAPVVAKLSSNENPWGPSPNAIAAMQAVIAEGHRYPDPASTSLREALGDWGVAVETVRGAGYRLTAQATLAKKTA